ncbi:hypothetical protein C0995_002139 [Termitomyces sp. Mi166|nr:hypothetical protein C0995_002139 [Termitomyces sp. Mi166\
MSYASVAAANAPPQAAQPSPHPQQPQPDPAPDDSDNDCRSRKKRANRHLKEVEAEGLYLWEATKHHLFRPGVAGLGPPLRARTVNTAVLGAVGYFAYVHWDRPTWDRRAVSAVAVGLLALWGAEGYVFAK